MAAFPDAENVHFQAGRCVAMWVAQVVFNLPRWVWVWLGMAAAAGAEESEWLVRAWQTEHGLPSSCVTAMAQTADGYLWVGTPKGLARFDGMYFKVFDSRQVPSLGEGRVGALLADRRGALWIATGEGSLLCYENGRFRTLQPGAPENSKTTAGFMQDATGKTLPISLQSQATLVEDGDGGIWWLPGDGGLRSCHGGTVVRHTNATGLPPGKLNGLTADDAGGIHLMAGGMLFCRSGGKWVGPENADVLIGQLPPLMTAARAGGVWVAGPRGSTVDGGRLIRRFESGRWRGQLETTPWTPNSMRSEVTTVLADHSGRMWVGMLWNGIWVSEAGGAWQRLQNGGSLSQCFITCLFEDRHGAVWAGTDQEGLHCISRRPVTVIQLPDIARENIITASCATRDGSIWMGTDGAGALRYEDGKFTPFGKAGGLDSPHVCSLLEDRQGRLWCGTWDGLFQWVDGRFARVSGLRELGQSVLALFEDRAGRLWVGTQGGLVCREGGTWTARKLLEPSVYLDIRSLAEDAAGHLWVGTIGQGLFRLDGETVTQFRHSGGFPGQDARALYCDPAGGAVWIGTMEHGLVRCQNGRFTAYTSADGLPSETIGSLMPDGDGNLWLGSSNGIFACSLRALDNYQRGTSPGLLCAHLTLAEGLVSRACSGSGQPVPCRTGDGRLWFPNFRGLAGFDPQGVAGRKERPRVVVESVDVDGVERMEADELRVSSSARRFEFHFTVPELVTPQALRFRYKLAGMDPDWVDAGPQRVATYSRLPPGKYQFQVMVGGADGQWHGAAAPLPLTVVPQFWELRWLQSLAGTGLVGAVAGWILLSQRRKHRRRLTLIQQARALEQERQRIAANIHDDLGASLTRITLLSDLARERAETGGIGAEIEQIHSTSRDLTRAMDEVVWAIAPEHDSLDSMVTYLGKIAQDLLRAAGVSCRLEIPATLPDLELTGPIRHNLLLAAKEALHNVVKHAAASEARVRASLQPGKLLLVVSDNGRGFDPAAEPGAARPGRGLRNMAARLRDIGGVCEVTSTPGSGTEVRFSIPLGAGLNHRN